LLNFNKDAIKKLCNVEEDEAWDIIKDLQNIAEIVHQSTDESDCEILLSDPSTFRSSIIQNCINNIARRFLHPEVFNRIKSYKSQNTRVPSYRIVE
jgi:hypothetical protein